MKMKCFWVGRLLGESECTWMLWGLSWTVSVCLSSILFAYLILNKRLILYLRSSGAKAIESSKNQWEVFSIAQTLTPRSREEEGAGLTPWCVSVRPKDACSLCDKWLSYRDWTVRKDKLEEWISHSVRQRNQWNKNISHHSWAVFKKAFYTKGTPGLNVQGEMSHNALRTEKGGSWKKAHWWGPHMESFSLCLVSSFGWDTHYVILSLEVTFLQLALFLRRNTGRLSLWHSTSLHSSSLIKPLNKARLSQDQKGRDNSTLSLGTMDRKLLYPRLLLLLSNVNST